MRGTEGKAAKTGACNAGNPISAGCVSAAPLLIQLPDNGLGKPAEDGPSVWAPATHIRET